MAGKAYVKKSPEQKAEEVKNAHEKIANAVAEVRNSNDWKAFLAFGAKFHNYSFNNMMLIYLQCKERGMMEPTRVASFRKWADDLKNPVAKGAKGLKIFAPIIVTLKPGDKGYVEGEKRSKCVGFRLVTVFDLQQTTDPSSAPKDVVREMYESEVTGAGPEGMAEALVQMISDNGYSFRFGDTGRAGGWANPAAKEVVISEKKAEGSPSSLRTMIHELAHVILHCEDDEFDYQAHRGIAETEAEGTAYVVGTYYGLNMGNTSAGYLASWSDEEVERIVKAGTRIMSTARTIIDTVDKYIEAKAHALAA